MDEQLQLEDELALLVLLARLVRLVVLPADGALASSAQDVAHDVPARRHVALRWLGESEIGDLVEEIRLTVLASEVLRDGERVISSSLSSRLPSSPIAKMELVVHVRVRWFRDTVGNIGGARLALVG